MVTGLAIAGGAQSSLRDDILAAAQAEDWSARLTKVDGERRPVATILDAVADVRRGAAACYWARITNSLLDPRRDEVIACWRREPEARVRRAAAFAAVSGIDWVGMYVAASTEERTHLEAVGSCLETWDRQVERDLRGAPGPRREAAAALQRQATRSARANPSSAVLALRRLQGTPEELQAVQLQDVSANAFMLASLLTDSEPAVRARAAAALRNVMSLPVPPRLVAALQDDPAPNIRTLLPIQPVTDADVPALIRAIGSGAYCQRLDFELGALTARARTQLATALIATARRIPPDPPVDESHPLLVHQPGTAKATRYFQIAASLGQREAKVVLGLAMNDPSVDVARRALAGLVRTAPAVLDPAGMGPMLLALLDYDDGAVSAAAAAVIDRTLGTRVESQLRDQVHKRARAIMTREAATLTFDRAWSSWCTGPAPIGPPKGAAAQLVHTAARIGDRALLDPLIAELARLSAAPADPKGALHLLFVLSCLGELAVHASETQARRLHELLNPEFAPKQAAPWDRGRHQLLVEQILFRIFPVVPEDLLGWWDERLSDIDVCDSLGYSLLPYLDAVPEARVRRIAKHLVRGRSASVLLLIRTPELLVEAWRAGGERERIACGALAMARERLDLVMPLVDRGALPAEFALAALAGGPLPLHVLCRLLPQGRDASEVARTVHAIARAPAGDAPADLPALQQLGASPVAAIAVAAAQRAARQDGGGALATAILERVFAGDDAAGAASALEAATLLGIGLQDVRARCTALFATTDWRRRMVVDAARLRFCGLDPRAVQSGYPADAIALSGIDVDAATLRAALGAQLHLHLPRLFAGCSPKTRISALELSAELPVWRESLERLVVAEIDNPDSAVRIAAYRALGSRDPELWQCPWLVHEARFDPDPDLRAAFK